MQVALVSNERFFPGLWATAISMLICIENAESISLTVIDFGIRDESWQRLEEAVYMHPHPPKIKRVPFPETLMRGLTGVSHERRPAYARLYLPELLETGPVLYLDSALLLFRDIRELGQINLSRFAGAAVLNEDGAYLGFDLDEQICKELGRQPDSHYFNTGVMLMNLDYWRSNNLTVACEEFLSKYNANYLDQTAINAVMSNELVVLEPDWNRLINRFPNSMLDNPGQTILHYCCEKPWLYGQETPAAQLFEKFCSDTGLTLPANREKDLAPRGYSWLDLPRAKVYQLLSFAFRLIGNQDRSKALLNVSAYWCEQFQTRHSRRKTDDRTVKSLFAKNYCPYWLSNRAASAGDNS